MPRRPLCFLLSCLRSSPRSLNCLLTPIRGCPIQCCPIQCCPVKASRLEQSPNCALCRVHFAGSRQQPPDLRRRVAFDPSFLAPAIPLQQLPYSVAHRTDGQGPVERPPPVRERTREPSMQLVPLRQTRTGATPPQPRSLTVPRRWPQCVTGRPSPVVPSRPASPACLTGRTRRPRFSRHRGPGRSALRTSLRLRSDSQHPQDRPAVTARPTSYSTSRSAWSALVTSVPPPCAVSYT